MKIVNKILYAVGLPLLLAGCEAGVVYEEVPESIYNNVELSSDLCNVTSRYLFTDKIYAVNWERPVENYMAVSTIGKYQKEADYTNTTSSAVTVLGKTVAPGETVKVKNSMEVVDEASAPDGKLYVLNILADSKAVYKTANNGYVFQRGKFSGDFELTDAGGTPTDAETSEYVKLPVNQQEVVVYLILSDESACNVTRIGDAPELGSPQDFTKPHRYLVTNRTRRPDGQPAAQRLYEIRMVFLP